MVKYQIKFTKKHDNGKYETMYTPWMESIESVPKCIKSLQLSKRISKICVYKRIVKNVTDKFLHVEEQSI